MCVTGHTPFITHHRNILYINAVRPHNAKNVNRIKYE